LTVIFFQEFATFLSEYKRAKSEGEEFYKPRVALQYLSGAKTVLENQFKDTVDIADKKAIALLMTKKPKNNTRSWYEDLRHSLETTMTRRCFQEGSSYLLLYCSSFSSFILSVL